MGIKGLQTFLENSGTVVTRELCVDGCGLLRLLLRPGPDWLRGPSYDRIRDNVCEFVERFHSAGFQLTVIFDGAIEPVKRATWFTRRKREATIVTRVFDAIHAEEQGGPPQPSRRADWVPPIHAMSCLRKAFVFAGAKVLLSLGEADREIAHYCKVNKCFGILSQDSDYFVLDVCRYFPLDSYKPREKGSLKLNCYEQERTLNFLKLRVEQLPMVAALTGNDYISPVTLVALQWKLVRRFVPDVNTGEMEKVPPADVVIPAVLAFLRTTHDPFSVLLSMTSAKVVEKIRLAAQQYSFAEIPNVLRPPTSLPAALVPHWPKIIDLHRTDRLYHEALAVLSYRCLNPGVILEDPSRRATWVISSRILRRIYGILLAGCSPSASPSPSPAASPSKSTFSLPTLSNGSPMPPVSPVVSSLLSALPSVSTPSPQLPMRASLPQTTSGPLSPPAAAVDVPSPSAASEAEDADEGEEGEGEEDEDEDDVALLPEEDDDLEDAEDDDDELHVVANLSSSSIVQEFVWYGGKNIRTPDVQTAAFDVDGIPLDPFHVLLTADRSRRLATYLLAMDCRDMHTKPLQAHYIPEATEPAELQAFELDALIATAVLQATKSPNYKGKPSSRGVPLHSATIHISSIFLRTMALAQFLNEACMQPLSIIGPWQYYNGAVFHRKYHEAKSGIVPSLVGDRAHHLRIYQMIRFAVVSGTRLAPAATPQKVPHTPARNHYATAQSPAAASPSSASPAPSHSSGGKRRPFVRSAPATPVATHVSPTQTLPPVTTSPPQPWSLAPDAPTVKPDFSAWKPKPCKYYQRGNCSFGDKCIYSHTPQ